MGKGENRNQKNYNADVFLTSAIIINTPAFGRTQKPGYLSLEVFFRKGSIWNRWEKKIRKKKVMNFSQVFQMQSRYPHEVNQYLMGIGNIIGSGVWKYHQHQYFRSFYNIIN